jgi:hypothetical protein
MRRFLNRDEITERALLALLLGLMLLALALHFKI